MQQRPRSYTPSLLEEYRDVPLALNAVGKIDHGRLKVLVSGVASFVSKAEVVSPQTKLAICRDMGDNLVLECCLAARAEFLISGDKDLLTIENLPFEVRILTPRRYVEEGLKRDSETMERSLINNFDPRGGNGQVIGPLPLPSLGAKQKLCAIARPDPGRFEGIPKLQA